MRSQRQAGFTLWQSLANANDRHHLPMQDRQGLAADVMIRFPQDQPPFTVPDDDVSAPDVHQHVWADLACERSRSLVVNVLRPQGDLRLSDDASDALQVDKRRTDGQISRAVRAVH